MEQSQDIKQKLENLRDYQATFIGLEACKKSAVCIPLIETDHEYNVLFEVRSSHIAHQPGDICFPGGMMESGESYEQTAIRETMEELLVTREQIQIIGPMDIFWGSTILVHPYAAILKDYKGSYSTDEVAETFCVPMSFFLNTKPEIYQNRMHVIPEEDFPYERIHGGKNYGWRERREDVYFYQYRDRTIWGMTARMMESFAKIYRAC